MRQAAIEFIEHPIGRFGFGQQSMGHRNQIIKIQCGMVALGLLVMAQNGQGQMNQCPRSGIQAGRFYIRIKRFDAQHFRPFGKLCRFKQGGRLGMGQYRFCHHAFARRSALGEEQGAVELPFRVGVGGFKNRAERIGNPHRAGLAVSFENLNHAAKLAKRQRSHRIGNQRLGIMLRRF